MQESEIRILAVNPGSRYIGIAVFHGPELADWGVKSIREASVKGKMERLKSIFVEIAGTHTVSCFVIKGLHPARSSKRLRKLTSEAIDWARKEGLDTREYSIHEIEASLVPSRKRNKKHLMEEVAARYPFLYPELEKERRNRNPYLVRMFEAVALGMRCLSDLEKSKGRKSVSMVHE